MTPWVLNESWSNILQCQKQHLVHLFKFYNIRQFFKIINIGYKWLKYPTQQLVTLFKFKIKFETEKIMLKGGLTIDKT